MSAARVSDWDAIVRALLPYMSQARAMKAANKVLDALAYQKGLAVIAVRVDEDSEAFAKK